jgi:myo-inositol-1(or 4)-monophosphatase
VWLDVAPSAAESATAALRDSGADGRGATRLAGRELKIAADGFTEDAILSVLCDQTPFPVLSEERGVTGIPHLDGLRWVVDPLDGSFNYARGFPLSCVSTALWRGETPLLGVVHDPVHDETFTGIVGEGAWLNGVPIRTSSISDASQGVLCTGFPARLRLTEAAVETVLARARQFMKVRLLGSAALSLAYVAAGRADGYAEDAINIWDVAAGLALVLAAGGRVEFAPHAGTDALDVVATNAFLRV